MIATKCKPPPLLLSACLEAGGVRGASAVVVPCPRCPKTQVLKLFFPKELATSTLAVVRREACLHAALASWAPAGFVKLLSADPEVALVADVVPEQDQHKWRAKGMTTVHCLRYQFGGPDLYRVAREDALRHVTVQEVLRALPKLMGHLAKVGAAGLVHNDITVRNVVWCAKKKALRLIDCALGGDTAVVASWMRKSIEDMPEYGLWPRDYRLYQVRHGGASPTSVFSDWKPNGPVARVRALVAGVAPAAATSPNPFARNLEAAMAAAASMTPAAGYPKPGSKKPFSKHAMSRLDVYQVAFTMLLFVSERADAGDGAAVPCLSPALLALFLDMCSLDPTRRPSMSDAARRMRLALTSDTVVP